MSFKQKLELAAADLMATKRAYDLARQKWDMLCATLPGLSEAEQMEAEADPKNLSQIPRAGFFVPSIGDVSK